MLGRSKDEKRTQKGCEREFAEAAQIAISRDTSESGTPPNLLEDENVTPDQPQLKLKRDTETGGDVLGIVVSTC